MNYRTETLSKNLNKPRHTEHLVFQQTVVSNGQVKFLCCNHSLCKQLYKLFSLFLTSFFVNIVSKQSSFIIYSILKSDRESPSFMCCKVSGITLDGSPTGYKYLNFLSFFVSLYFSFFLYMTYFLSARSLFYISRAAVENLVSIH